MFKTVNGKELYRIGDCIISVNAQNPSVNFGGVWELLCPGRTIVCIDTNDGDFNSLKKTGGSKYLQSHNHNESSAGGHVHEISMDSSGNHSHTLPFNEYRFNSIAGSNYALAYVADSYRPANKVSSTNGGHTHSLHISTQGAHSHTIASTGSGNSQNLQPFMAVYIWVRVA